MRLPRVALVALALVLVAPVSGQEDHPYFSLTSSRTYAPGEKPTIELWTQNVDALDFRVYRVRDPVLFFQKLEDIHRFGGQAAPPPRVPTLLESFHQWKRSWRIWIRDIFREQFGSDSRARIRDWQLEREREAIPHPAQFAQVPLLNSQQLVTRWRQTIPRGFFQRWESQTIPVDLREKGVYLVEAAYGELRAYTILVVTDLAVVTKASPGHVLAYAVDRRTGAPVSGCTVWVWSSKKEVARLETDTRGLAEARLADDKPEGTLVLAQHGEDFAADSLYDWYLASDPERSWTGYVYTDRPVYRPGHTVYFKGILRQRAGSAYRLPDRREVQVEIQDPDSKPVFRKTLPVSAMGTISGEFEVPASAALGYYGVQVRAGSATSEGGFQVEEYKKPEYEVKVIPEARRVLQGEPLRATLEARYYFGEPVAGAKVTYVVHRSRYWFPLYAEEEEESEEGEEDYYYGGEQILEESGTLDPEGRLRVTIPTEVSDRRVDFRYRIEARVTDQSNREIAGFGSELATYGSYLVNVQADQYLYEPGQRARLRIEARDYDGDPVSAAVRLELRPWSWKGGEREGPAVFSAEARTDATGATQVEVPLPQGGSYVARVTSHTPEGREVEDRAWLWVQGRGAWWSGARETLTIVPDKKSYRPGETARVLIVTGVPEAHVLVTTEGNELYSSEVVSATGPTVTVDVPIRAEHAPNFFVSAAFLRENKLYTGSKSVRVPPVEHQLTVEVVPTKSQYKPAEPAVFTVTARDHAGRPVAAEVSLGVVDEAIYAIRPEAAADILKFFYGRIGNRVLTDSSLTYYFHGEAGKRRMQLTSLRPSRAMAQLKPERVVEPRVRKAFPDTIFWAATLTTGADGRAQARFEFPDSLTAWRATARAVTQDTRVGSAVNRVIVRKNLILRLAVPRFFRQGDEVTVSVIVHNYLSTEKKAQISLQAEGVEILEGGTQDVAIPSRGEARVDWRVRAGTGREVRLLGKGLTDEESDAMELTLPIVPYGVKLAQARAGAVAEPAGEREVEINFLGAIVPNSRRLRVSVSPSLAGAIFGALEFLTSYPYGCTEQTMSSFLPNVIVVRALEELGVKSDLDRAELDKKIRAGLKRLYDFQHEDGGWGWWQTDDSGLFMTAYVLSGLAQAQAAGVNVDSQRMNRARDWLRAALDREPRLQPDLRAYALYALVQAGDKDRARIEAAWEKRAEMTPYGLALLGLALEAAGDPRAEEAAGQIEKLAQVEDSEAHWQVDYDWLMDFYGDTSPEATAYALKLLSHLRPQSPLLEKAALWLVTHRDQGYWWYSTKQTAMVIFGLTDYLKRSGELRPSFSVQVWVNDKSVLSRSFSAADALAPVEPTVELTADDLGPGTNKIRIRKTGTGRLYWSVRAEYYSTEENLAATGTLSLNLVREYFRLVPVRAGEKIVHRLEPFDGTARPGEVLVVRLTVTGDLWRYLLIEDPIPAGTEFIERDDLYELESRPSWWWFWFDRREFHDDRAAIFQTYFGRGQRQYLYLLKVVNPGRFRVSPARVEPMYQPQYFSTSTSQTVEVK